MFQRLHDPVRTVSILVDGAEVVAAEGDSVAAALLLAGMSTFRRMAKDHAPRGPYCGMGVCFDCLVTIDGEPNRQACLTPVREGLRVETGAAAPQLAALPR